MSKPSDEFATLRKLLATKRHEQPPPGYFERFSGRVIRRLEADGPEEETSRWDRWMTLLSAKPLLACAYGGVVAASLLVGFKMAEGLAPEPAIVQVESIPWRLSLAEPSIVFGPSTRPKLIPVTAGRSLGPASGTALIVSAPENDLAISPVSYNTWSAR